MYGPSIGFHAQSYRGQSPGSIPHSDVLPSVFTHLMIPVGSFFLAFYALVAPPSAWPAERDLVHCITISTQECCHSTITVTWLLIALIDDLLTLFQRWRAYLAGSIERTAIPAHSSTGLGHRSQTRCDAHPNCHTFRAGFTTFLSSLFLEPGFGPRSRLPSGSAYCLFPQRLSSDTPRRYTFPHMTAAWKAGPKRLTGFE